MSAVRALYVANLLSLVPFTLLADLRDGNPKKVPQKTWAPHAKDWQPGDPTWKDGKLKGLIKVVNYLSGKGCNAFSFLRYTAGGDGYNVTLGPPPSDQAEDWLVELRK